MYDRLIVVDNLMGAQSIDVNSDIGFLRELSMQKGGCLDFDTNKYIIYIYDLIVKCRKLY